MRWNKDLNFILSIILSIAAGYVTLLNFLEPLHAKLIYLAGPVVHPVINIGYLLLSLVIIWTIYLSPRRRSSGSSFAVTVVVGIVLIVVGLFLWDIAAYFEDTVRHIQR